MGWGYGINSEGREIGYDVSATCDHPGCNKEIHHGLAYVCGDMHDGGEHDCGEYFCYDHLKMTEIGQFCEECYDNIVECSGFKACRGKKFDPDNKDCQVCLKDAMDARTEYLWDITDEDLSPTLPWSFP